MILNLLGDDALDYEENDFKSGRREEKRKRKMKVSGSSVKTLQRVIIDKSNRVKNARGTIRD